jgi:hypothetical protein
MSILLVILLAILSTPGLLGLYVIWHIVRPQKAPADTTNRINKIRLLHYVMTREDVMARIIDWLRKDEGEIAPLPSLPSEVPAGKRRSQP